MKCEAIAAEEVSNTNQDMKAAGNVEVHFDLIVL
jgi:hypothetical protein